MNFEGQQQEKDVSSPEAQEALATEYLAAHQEWTRSMQEWQGIDQARIINEAESGHMGDRDAANEEYRAQMAEATAKMDVSRSTMDRISPQLTEETKDKFLTVKVPASS